jgi:hypothetical protein
MMATATPNVKTLIVALICTPFVYALGAALLEALNYSGSFLDGRLLLAVSFFLSFSVAQFFFRDNQPREKGGQSTSGREPGKSD